MCDVRSRTAKTVRRALRTSGPELIVARHVGDESRGRSRSAVARPARRAFGLRAGRLDPGNGALEEPAVAGVPRRALAPPHTPGRPAVADDVSRPDARGVGC